MHFYLGHLSGPRDYRSIRGCASLLRLDGCSYQLCAGARDDKVIHVSCKIRGGYVDDLIITRPSAQLGRATIKAMEEKHIHVYSRISEESKKRNGIRDERTLIPV